jgi:hypothetical protein
MHTTVSEPSRSRSRPSGRAQRALAPRPVGWRTTDADEIALRRERAAAERIEVENRHPAEPVFSSFCVRSPSGSEYLVEIRSLVDMENSCSCPDFRTNGLGTCKHVEAVLSRLRRKRATAGAGQRSRRAEVFLRRTGEPAVAVALPANGRLTAQTRATLQRYFDDTGHLRGDPAEAVPSLVRALESAGSADVRVSQEVIDWASERARRAAREVARQTFMDELRAGRRSLALLKLPLYPYQTDGMLHLAFGGRTLLGDEMGLGKTVQAVAACALLKELHGIERVLVVCPVSLKTEWEEQIGEFTDLPLQLVLGTKPSRLARYDAPAFFTIANYEQVVRDMAEINGRLRPDVVILDEAQRIKNWNTKTARTLKRLDSRYAFLLSGTPIENRIDEIYSIAEFLDPQVFGPLFRFNREFYELDDRGRPTGYRNLDELHRRIRPLLLRRRKDQIEEQLPQRVDNNYFVAMSPAQTELYDEYKDRVARLLGTAKRRPLTREEHEKLQKWLACMRMLCDTPYILSPQTRVCPKLHELEAVLEDLNVRGECKAIIFSEWERMLDLVRDLVREMGLDFAWHTGSVPQGKRRAEIQRFKTDPACRLFLSTDSGGLGLNLQVASVVINLDLPWNPARLEQRIARAWRKHQTRSVHVVNLISENTIEHQMLATLAAKRELADRLLDGRGELGTLRMPTAARQGFLDRLRQIVETQVAPAASLPAHHASPVERLRARLGPELGAHLVDIHVVSSDSAAVMALVIIDGAGADAGARVTAEWPQFAQHCSLPIEAEVIDASTWETLQRLARRGLVPALRPELLPDRDPAAEARRRARARELMDAARRKMGMAELLRGGGFAIEALAPARDAVDIGVRAAAIGHALVPADDDACVSEALLRGELLARAVLRNEHVDAVLGLRQAGEGASLADTEHGGKLIEHGAALLRHVGDGLGV